MEEKIILDLIDADSGLLAREIGKILIEKKGVDIRIYDIRSTEGITDYYVNVTGRSSTHVASLADDLVDIVGRRGKNELRVEGKRGNAWILVDYGDVIVNVFDRESRNFYNFDRLLPDGSEIDISGLIAEVDKKFELNKKEEV